MALAKKIEIVMELTKQADPGAKRIFRDFRTVISSHSQEFRDTGA